MDFRTLILSSTTALSLLSSASIFASTDVNIDLNTEKFIGGVSQLDRKKFFNIHSGYSPKAEYEEKWNYLVNELNVGFGRNFWSPFSQHTGFAPYPDEETARTNGAKSIATTKNTPYFSSYFSNRNVVTDHPSKAFKADIDPVEAAAWAANYFKHYFDDETRPMFYEPINEPFVHAGEFGIEDELARTQIAHLFKEIGKAFDQQNINTQVIGYASAWPSMELWDFRHFRERQQMFMDVAGDYMDALSIHLYDGINVEGANSQRSGSNLEAILDLVETYSYYKWGAVKPLAISEYGGIEKGYGDDYSDIKSIQSVRSINNMLFQLLDRQDRMLTSIPFITGNASWFYSAENNWQPYGAVILRPDPDSIVDGKPTNFFWTPRIHFYQLWADVKGQRVKATSTNEDIQVQAFVKDNRAYVALNSLSDNEQLVNLQFINDMGWVSQVRKKQLKIYPNAQPIYSDQVDIIAPSTLTLIAGESVVLEYIFSSDVELNKTLEVNSYYALEHLLAINANDTINFTFADVEIANGQSILKMAIARDHAKSKMPVVTVNGTEIDVATNWKGGDQASRGEFFGAIHIPVANELLVKDNRITVTFPDTGGRVSSMVLVVSNEQSVIENNDTVAFKNPISTLSPDDSYTIPISYYAAISRDLVLEIWQGDSYLASDRKTVEAGTGIVELTVILNQATQESETNYILKSSIRPVGEDWSMNIAATQLNGISIDTPEELATPEEPENPIVPETPQDKSEDGSSGGSTNTSILLILLILLYYRKCRLVL